MTEELPSAFHGDGGVFGVRYHADASVAPLAFGDAISRRREGTEYPLGDRCHLERYGPDDLDDLDDLDAPTSGPT